MALLANLTPMPMLNCIVRHLALLCCEDSADIGCADIVATITMFSLQLPDNQWLVGI
jgi:hypothetical protein